MTSNRTKARNFCGMTYREVQRSNTNRITGLPRLHQRNLKLDGFRNVGWEHVIRLYQRLNAIDEELESDRETLEELFLKADRVGNKYQTPDEIRQHWADMATEVSEIAELIDQQFPDQASEHVDFSQPQTHKVIARV